MSGKVKKWMAVLLTAGVLVMAAGVNSLAAEEEAQPEGGAQTSGGYTITYDYNNPAGERETRPYGIEVLNINVIMANQNVYPGYAFTGWYYEKEDGSSIFYEEGQTIIFKEAFGNDTTPTLVAGWVQTINVNIDGTPYTPIEAGSAWKHSFPAKDDLKLESYEVNGVEVKVSDSNLSASIQTTVKEANGKKYTKIVGDGIGYGITTTNPNITIGNTRWAPAQEGGYLIRVDNQTGHQLNVNGQTIVSGGESGPLGIYTEIPEGLFGEHFTVGEIDLKNEGNWGYAEYQGVQVKCLTVTLEPEDITKNITVSFTGQGDFHKKENLVASMSSGETLSAQKLLDQMLDSVTYGNYLLNGWSCRVQGADGKWSDYNKDLKTEFGFEEAVYAFEFTPIWAGEIYYDVNFPGEIGTDVELYPNPQYVNVGETITKFPAPEDRQNRYVFQGWKDPDDNFYPPTGVGYTVTEPKVTFTGQWEPVSYKVTWDGDKGDTEHDISTVSYGKAVDFKTPSSRPGYTFLGWKYEGTLYDVGDTFPMPNKDITMTAQWSINTYKVQYDGNGTTVGVYNGTDEMKYGGKYEIRSDVTPTRAGYTFLGWKDGETLYASGGSFSMPGRDVTLTAQWKLAVSTISEAGTYYLIGGQSYTLAGGLKVQGDASAYAGGEFYVPQDGDYTFQ